MAMQITLTTITYYWNILEYGDNIKVSNKMKYYCDLAQKYILESKL